MQIEVARKANFLMELPMAREKKLALMVSREEESGRMANHSLKVNRVAKAAQKTQNKELFLDRKLVLLLSN
jgi:hypothetical protein